VLNRSRQLSVVKPATDSSLRTVTGHAGLAGNTSGNQDDLRALEGVGEARGSGVVSADLQSISIANGLRIGGRIVPRSWC